MAKGVKSLLRLLTAALLLALALAGRGVPLKPEGPLPASPGPAASGVKSSPLPESRQDLIDRPAIEYVKMVNENLGFVICSHGFRRTLDGGKTWGPLTHPELSFGKFLNGAVIDFINPRTGWIAVGSQDEPTTIILRTGDGGDSWAVTRLSQVAGILSLDFLDEQHGWLLANTWGGALGSSDAELYSTEDGGKQWTEIMATEADSSTPGALPFAGHKSGLNFQDQQTGWAGGGSGWSNDIWLYETNDGGHTWKPQAIPQPRKTLFCAYPNTSPPKFFANNEGVFSVVFHGGGANQKMAFYRTLDGGKSWTPSTSVAIVSEAFAADFVSSEAGWVVNGKEIEETGDGGEHWRKITPNLEFSGIAGLTLVSPKIAFVTTFVPANSKSSQDAWELYKTVDGGHNWTAMNLMD